LLLAKSTEVWLFNDQSLFLSQPPRLGESPEAAIVSLFHLIREATAGQLLAFQVVLQAFTTNPFAAAAGITAIAKIHIFFFFTFHHNVLSVGLSSS
jgi:hypothetical protein